MKERLNKKKDFTRLVDFGDAISSRTKSASPKLTTGFMMVEVLVAVSIISVSILAAMMVAQKSIQLSQRSLGMSQATYLLEEGAEATRIVRDNGWNNISAQAVDTDYCLAFQNGTWNLNSNLTDCQIGSFTRTVRFINVNRDATTGDIVSAGGVLDSGTKLVTVSVSWNNGGQQVIKNLSFYLMNIFL